jgi:hypothetical protein
MHVQLYLSFLSALFFGGPSQRRPPVVAGVRLAVPWFSCEIISAICWPRDCICVPAIVEMLTARRSSKQTDTPTEMHIKTKKDANQHAQLCQIGIRHGSAERHPNRHANRMQAVMCLVVVSGCVVLPLVSWLF